MSEEILKKRNGEYDYVHDEIIDRIGDLYIKCPECESIIYDDDQYACTTCWGGSRINVLEWIKKEMKDGTK